MEGQTSKTAGSRQTIRQDRSKEEEKKDEDEEKRGETRGRGGRQGQRGLAQAREKKRKGRKPIGAERSCEVRSDLNGEEVKEKTAQTNPRYTNKGKGWGTKILHPKSTRKTKNEERALSSGL